MVAARRQARPPWYFDDAPLQPHRPGAADAHTSCAATYPSSPLTTITHIPSYPPQVQRPAMPTTSALSADEKAKVKAAVPTSSFKIQTATPARVYYAFPGSSNWSYSGLQGGLAFGQDKSRNTFHLKMVDISGTRGVVWEHELYEGFEYFEDRPYFHTFEGDVSNILIAWNTIEALGRTLAAGSHGQLTFMGDSGLQRSPGRRPHRIRIALPGLTLTSPLTGLYDCARFLRYKRSEDNVQEGDTKEDEQWCATFPHHCSFKQ